MKGNFMHQVYAQINAIGRVLLAIIRKNIASKIQEATESASLK